MRRFIYDGWDNYTEYEKKMIQDVKITMNKKNKIDLDQIKDFGPKAKSGKFVAGESKVISGRDIHFNDSDILKFLVCR